MSRRTPSFKPGAPMPHAQPDAHRPSTPRRGSALIMVLIFTAALGALAMSAIFLSGNATTLASVADRESQLNFAAEAALQIGKSRINSDPNVLPMVGDSDITPTGGVIQDANGTAIPGVTVRLWVGPTGTATAQRGSFASVVAAADDGRGGRVVRRLEVLRESFAKFAYFSTLESNNGSPIYFTGGDVLSGPVWSNSMIYVSPDAGGVQPWFKDSVGTASTVNGAPSSGRFDKGYRENLKAIALPSTAQVATLRALATPGSLAFTGAGTQLDPTTRIEFVSVDMSAPAYDDAECGYVRVFSVPATATTAQKNMLRGEFGVNNCGDWHTIKFSDGTTRDEFFPIAAHSYAWFKDYVSGNYTGTTRTNLRNAADNEKNKSTQGTPDYSPIMTGTRARCFPAGAPELFTTEWMPAANTALDPYGATFAANAANYHGGTAYSWPDGFQGSTVSAATNPTARASGGKWQLYVPPAPYTYPTSLTTQRDDSTGVTGTGASDIHILFPLETAMNAQSKGVIDIAGPVAVSGRVRGFYTLHSTSTVLFIDDLIYNTVPGAGGASSTGQCRDILGIVADSNVYIADNGILTPQPVGSSGGSYIALGSNDNNTGTQINAIIMALKTSWQVENYNTGPTSVVSCNGQLKGRGCLTLIGGLIQYSRGAVGTSSGSGYLKRYNYDVCAVQTPPPYFPTTGRFTDNAYQEIDPATFNVDSLFMGLQPGP